MSTETYTAILDSGDTSESVELEFIDGGPQRSLVRVEDVDGVASEVSWELDPDAIDYTYRPVEVDASAE